MDFKNLLNYCDIQFEFFKKTLKCDDIQKFIDFVLFNKFMNFDGFANYFQFSELKIHEILMDF